MSFQYFSQEQINEIATTINELIGYDPLTRAALLGGLPPAFRGLLPGAQAAPRIGILVDLGMLNMTERLVDGTVPLKSFLKSAVSLTGMVENADLLRRALDEIEVGTTGAPPVVTLELPEMKEAIIFRDEMVPFDFMEGGVAAARAIAKLTVSRYQDGQLKMANGKPVVYLGTGWLVAPGLLMTNHHVINARNQGEEPATAIDLQLQAMNMGVLFDYDGDGMLGTSMSVKETVAWDPALDYALVRLVKADRRPLSHALQAITNVTPNSSITANIIQHPDGRPKRFGIRNNLVTAATPDELRYFTDTLGGSSGAPVFNDTWQVIALHRGSAFVRGVKFLGRDVAYVNVGTQISAIMHHLRQNFFEKIPDLGM